MNLPLHRPLYGPIASALTAPRISAPASAGTWDPAHKDAAITLSNGNLTATSEDDIGGSVRGLPSRSSGAYALKFVPVFTGAAEDNECGVGVGLAAFAPPSAILAANGFALWADGAFWSGGGPQAPLPITFASGASVYIYIDITAGKGWYDTVANVTAADREAGTNPHFTFTPAELWPGADIYSADAAPSASVTLDPNYSSGRFAAWS